ncbi:30S ribosomal protein S16 [Candidatus Peregrinibacteria bacterium CG11_big_fil_rev_8_21_14_0_20_46_8]|nr:MAG: 30S ribosomal protein S16 [Candidatus Peregrinibacteria bacterium CG11_big_fil_rev_8_21_14_0_20_46_8]
MLRIRFSRTGKKGQASFRIIVAEAHAPVKGRHVEIVGHYMPTRDPKIAEIKKERVTYWISKGAIPTDSVASLLKKEGMENMDKYIVKPRDLKRKKKKGGDEEAQPVPTESAAPKAAAPAAEAPAPQETKEETPEPPAEGETKAEA